MKLSKAFHIFLALAAVLILIDFVWPGAVRSGEVIEIKRSRQNYYNAAQGYHYSYRVILEEIEFPVTEEFAALLEDQKRVEYSTSPLFKEVDWYGVVNSKDHSTYSLRLVSGIFLPILFLLLLFISYRFGKKMGSLLFVMQVLMLANIVLVIT